MPDKVDPCDVLYEVRLLDARLQEFFHEFQQYRAEINGDHAWLRLFRTRVSEASRIGLVLLPVLVAALLAVYLTS